VLRVEAHYVLAMSLLLNGAVVPARAQLEKSLANYDQTRSATHISLYSQDPGVVCLIRLSLALWILGDPEAAAQRRAESLRLADELAHPFTLGYALVWDAVLRSHRGEPDLARTQAEAAIRLGRDHRMPFWLSIATIIRGWAVAEQGDIETGIDEIRKGMADFRATGSLFMRPFQLGLLAEQYGRLGNVERGLTLIAEALALVERTNERWCEAELYRRKGDLLAKSSGDGEAEAAYRRAVDVAHYQGARGLELRSATRLADVWLRQERTFDVAPLLEPIVQSFGSATDLPDLDCARAILGQAGSVDRPRTDLTLH
jgi:predicted ATPase